MFVNNANRNIRPTPRQIVTGVAALLMSLSPLFPATAATPEKERSVATATVSAPPLMRNAPAANANRDQVSCEPALTSEVAGVTFRSRASRITDAETVEALVRPLRQLAANQGTALSHVEVLGWGANGADQPFPQSHVNSLMGEVTTSLQGAGFVCALPTGASRQQGTTTVTLVTASRPGDNARVMGFWIKTDHALLLAWGRVEESGKTGSVSETPVVERPASTYNPALL